jgi:hypothetical protein
MQRSFPLLYRTTLMRWTVLFGSILTQAMAPPARAQATSDTTILLFEFSKSVSENFWRTMFATLERNNLRSLVGPAVVIVHGTPPANRGEFSKLVEVALTGDCAAGRDTRLTTHHGPLGWVYLDHGRIQPFVFVDCTQIGEVLHRQLRGRTISEREQFMASAITHVIVHELGHIVTNDPGHQKTGLQKPRLTIADLIADERQSRRPAVAPGRLSRAVDV